MNTSQIGFIKILSESGISAGVRRIEALTGKAALEYYHEQEAKVKAMATGLKVNPDVVFQKVESMAAQLKDLQKELEKAKTEGSANLVDEIWSSDAHEEINGIHVVVTKLDNTDADALKALGDQLKDKSQGKGVFALFGLADGKVSIVVMAGGEAAAKGIHAGNIVKDVVPIVDGRGGGKPTMAQAGGTNAVKVDEAMAKALELIKACI